MDDFGNTYQDEAWFTGNEQYAFSVNTFGMFDSVSLDICFFHQIDYAAQDI